MKQNRSNSKSLSSNQNASVSQPIGSSEASGRSSNGPRNPTFEETSARAYQLWEKSGLVHDQHLDHWYEAERQLREESSGAPSSVVH